MLKYGNRMYVCMYIFIYVCMYVLEVALQGLHDNTKWVAEGVADESMYVCMYVYMYVCMYALYVCMYASKHTFASFGEPDY